MGAFFGDSTCVFAFDGGCDVVASRRLERRRDSLVWVLAEERRR